MLSSDKQLQLEKFKYVKMEKFKHSVGPTVFWLDDQQEEILDFHPEIVLV